MYTLPGPVDPSNKLKNNNVEKVDHQQVKNINNVEQVGPNKLNKNNVEQVGSYMLIYLHIPSYDSSD